MDYPKSLEDLMAAFRRLPGIGKKTARRLALYCVQEKEASQAFARALDQVREQIHPCRICGNITEEEICPICASHKRDRTTITVVEDVSNLMAIEGGGAYFGLYHVLRGLLSPMSNRGPEEIGLDQLVDRIQARAADDPVKEVILAISPTIEGETTMLYLAEMLAQTPVKVTRIASGIPVGGSLEYYDELTLLRAMQDRRGMDGI